MGAGTLGKILRRVQAAFLHLLKRRRKLILDRPKCKTFGKSNKMICEVLLVITAFVSVASSFSNFYEYFSLFFIKKILL